MSQNDKVSSSTKQDLLLGKVQNLWASTQLFRKWQSISILGSGSLLSIPLAYFQLNCPNCVNQFILIVNLTGLNDSWRGDWTVSVLTSPMGLHLDVFIVEWTISCWGPIEWSGLQGENVCTLCPFFWLFSCSLLLRHHELSSFPLACLSSMFLPWVNHEPKRTYSLLNFRCHIFDSAMEKLTDTQYLWLS